MENNPASQITVLLGFGHATTRDAFSVMFRKWGYTVLAAGTGEEVLRECSGHPETSLVILGIDLGDSNGLEVLRQIRDFSRDIPVFMLTAYISIELLKLASLLGCNEILQTPVGEQELQSLVAKYVFNS